MKINNMKINNMKINNMNITFALQYTSVIANKLSEQGKPVLWTETKIVTNIDQIELSVILLCMSFDLTSNQTGNQMIPYMLLRLLF